MERCMCSFSGFLYVTQLTAEILSDINSQSLFRFVAAHVPCSETLLSLIFILKSESFLQLTYPVLCPDFKWMKATSG